MNDSCPLDLVNKEASATVEGLINCNVGEACEKRVCHRGIDTVGNKGDIERSDPFRIDKKKPKTPVIVPPSDQWQTTDFEVEISGDFDEHSGLDKCYFHVLDIKQGWTKTATIRDCALFEDKGFAVTVRDAETNALCQTQGLGSCHVLAYSQDKVGNISEVTVGSFSVSYTEPRVDEFSVDREILNIANPTATFDWQVSAPGGAPLAKLEVFKNGAPYNPSGSLLVSGWSASGQFSDSPKQGIHTYYIHILDEAGNEKFSDLIVVTFDNAPPETSIWCNWAECQDGWYNKADGEVMVSFTCEDNILCDKTYYNNKEYTEPFNLDEGEHNFEFYSTDKAGNQEAVASKTIKRDITEPVVETGGASLDCVGTDQTAVFSCADNLSGCDTASYTFYITRLTDYSFSYQYGNSATISSYSWVQGYAQDKAGNSAISQEIDEFKIDKTPPAIPAIFGFAVQPEQVNIAKNTATIFWDVNDLVGYSCGLKEIEVGRQFEEGEEKILYSSVGPFDTLYTDNNFYNDSQFDQGDGAYWYTLYVIDNANNEKISDSIKVEVDLTAPDPPTCEPGSDEYIESVEVTCSAEPGAVISYTANDVWTAPPLIFYQDTVLKAVATDPAGNPSAEAVENYTILPEPDESPPETSIWCNWAECEDGWYISPVDVSFICTDNTTPVSSGCDKTYWCKWGNDTCIPDKEYDVELVKITLDGANYVGFYSTDKAENKEAKQTQIVKLDQTPPDVTVEQSPGAPGVWTNETQTAFLVCEDNASGCNSATYMLCTGLDCQFRPERDITFHTSVYGYAYDNAGHANFSERVFKVDKDAPTATFSADQAQLNLVNRTVTFTWTASDTGGSGLKQIELRRDGAAISFTSASGDFDSGTLNDTPSASDIYEYTIYVEDNAGNTYETVQSLRIPVEIEAPPKPTCSPASGSYVESVEVTCVDVEEGAVIRYTTDGREPAIYHPEYYTQTFYSNATLTVAAWDMSNNRSETPDNVYTYIIEPYVGFCPDTKIDSGPDDPTKETIATFYFSAESESPILSYKCRLDSGTWNICSSGKSYYLAGGDHIFEVKAINQYCAQGDESPAKHSWLIDSTAPDVNLFRPDSVAITLNKRGILISWGVEDKGVGIKKIKLWRRKQGESWEIQKRVLLQAPYPSSSSGNFGYYFPKGIEATYEYKLYVEDALGNSYEEFLVIK